MTPSRTYRTADYEDGREYVARVLKTQYLLHRPTGRLSQARFSADHAVVGDYIRVARVEYGLPLEVDVGWPDCYYLVLPLSARCHFQTADAERTIGQGEAAFVAPAAYVRINVEEHTQKLIVRIDRNVLERWFGWDEENAAKRFPVHFLNLRSSAGEALAAEVRAYIACLERPEALPRVESPLDRLGNALRPLVEPSRTAGESIGRLRADAIVGRAESFMRRHLGDRIALDDVAGFVKASPRSMFLAFQTVRRYAPHAYLRRVRLESARVQLCQGAGNSSPITDVAMQNGFDHFGRFSVTYRRRFGESPSDTVRRQRQLLSR
jgi:AraC-like DNA-binding protein